MHFCTKFSRKDFFFVCCLAMILVGKRAKAEKEQDKTGGENLRLFNIFQPGLIKKDAIPNAVILFKVGYPCTHLLFCQHN